MYERVKDSADNMMMATVVKVGECTGFTVISCPFVKQTSTPSGSQPLTLRARHLPPPQGTAFIRRPRFQRGINSRAQANPKSPLHITSERAVKMSALRAEKNSRAQASPRASSNWLGEVPKRRARMRERKAVGLRNVCDRYGVICCSYMYHAFLSPSGSQSPSLCASHPP